MKPTDAELERYLDNKLSDGAKCRLETALQKSPVLRARLDALRADRALLEAVKDSFNIRLPDAEEEAIVTKGIHRLKSIL